MDFESCTEPVPTMSFCRTLLVEEWLERKCGERGPRWARRQEELGSIDVRKGRILELLGIVNEIHRDPVNVCSCSLNL